MITCDHVPFVRPTLSELVTRIREDFRGRLEIEGQLLRRALADVMAVVWAGAAHMMHGHLEWISRQLFPQTAESEGVERGADFYGLARTPATFASGAVTATGDDGEPIPVETVLVRDDGLTYRVTAAAVIAGGSAILSVDAVEAGSAGDLAAGESVSFESPIPNIDSGATVTTPIDGGFDQESTEDLLARLLLRVQEPPTGGSDQDYEAWALAVPGVTRAWVFRHENGLGTVVVRFVLDNEPIIFPTPLDVAAVQESIDSQRPTTAEATAAGPVQLDINPTISITPDTPATRAAVTAELDDLLRREAQPGDGLGAGTVFLSTIRTAIGIADGVEDYDMTFPAANIVPAVGELAVLGTITWF